MELQRGLKIERLSVTYKGKRRPALREISLELEPGLTFLLGMNGAGKTTLFRSLLGDLPLQSGEFRLADGSRWSSPGGKSLVGYCPQDFEAPGHLRVVDYLNYLGWLKGMSRNETAEDVDRCIEKVGLKGESLHRISTLSGGMLRRVGIAQALLGDPDLILLDEPTVGLDPVHRASLRSTITDLGKRAIILISTHLLEDVRASEARMIILTGGTVAHSGYVSDFATADASRFETTIVRLLEVGKE